MNTPKNAIFVSKSDRALVLRVIINDKDKIFPLLDSDYFSDKTAECVFDFIKKNYTGV